LAIEADLVVGQDELVAPVVKDCVSRRFTSAAKLACF